MSYIGNGPGVASQRVASAFTATAGQTTFTTLSGYTIGYCDVYHNGVKLINGDDYTAADGVNVVLTAAAALNDAVEVVAFFPRGLSDGYMKAEADARFLNLAGGTLTGALSIQGSTGTVGFNAAGDQLLFGYNGYNYLTASGAAATLQVQATGANGAVAISTAGTTRGVFNATGLVLPTGKLGVGTSTPNKAFVVSNAAADGIEFSPNDASTSNLNRILSYNRTSGSAAYTPLVIQGSELRLYTKGASADESLRVDGSGKVGIGGSPTGGWLHVKGDWPGGHSTVKAQTVTSFAAGGTCGYGIYDSDGTRTGLLIAGGTGTPLVSIETSSGVPISFVPAGTERARIEADGDLRLRAYVGGVTGSVPPAIKFYTEQTNGQAATLAKIRATSTGNWDGALIFETKASNGTPDNTTTERARLDSGGKFLLGVSSLSTGTGLRGLASGYDVFQTTIPTWGGGAKTVSFTGGFNYFIEITVTVIGNASSGIHQGKFLAGRRDWTGANHMNAYADLVNTGVNCSVSTSDSGDTRTYTVTFTNGADGANNHWVLDFKATNVGSLTYS